MCCVMFVSTLGFLSDGEDNDDSRSAPGNRDGPTSVLGRIVSIIDERQGKQSSFDGAVVLLVSRWSPSFPFSGYSVMSHIWSWALCVQNHKRNTVFIKVTSGKHYLSNRFSHAYGIRVPLRKMCKIVFWLMKTSN